MLKGPEVWGGPKKFSRGGRFFRHLEGGHKMAARGRDGRDKDKKISAAFGGWSVLHKFSAGEGGDGFLPGWGGDPLPPPPHGHVWQQDDKAKEERRLLLVVVLSAVGNRRKRDSIRRSWAGQDLKPPRVEVVFLLGRPREERRRNRNASTSGLGRSSSSTFDKQQKLELEQARFGDIIQVCFSLHLKKRFAFLALSAFKGGFCGHVQEPDHQVTVSAEAGFHAVIPLRLRPQD